MGLSEGTGWRQRVRPMELGRGPSLPRQASAPSLAQHLRGNLAGQEAAVASLVSVEVGRSGSKDVLTFPWRPWL